MRSHAKALTARSTRHRATVALAAMAALCATLLAPAPAFAATVTDRPLLFSFDGSDGTAGKIKEGRAMAVDESSGVVYVIDGGKSTVDKFNANGEAIPFASTGESSLSGVDTPQGSFLFSNGASSIAVDDHGPNLGHIYISGSLGEVSAFNSAGEYLWQFPPGTFFDAAPLAVDTAGHLWVSDWRFPSTAARVREFAATGSPPAQLSSFTPAANPRALDLDTSGNIYLQRESGELDKYVGGVFNSIIDSVNRNVTVDQSGPTGHIFSQHTGDFNEYDSAGSLIGTFGANVGFSAQGIGYNPSLDRVYFATFFNDVLAFGPSVTGTTPDPVVEAPSEVGVAKAKFHGKVNSQSVPNSYYFEWKKGTGSTWAGPEVGAKTSPPQALPEDSSEHTVEFATNTLRGNTTYQVRLVGENTANGLRTWSSAETFATSQAAASPAVTIAAPSGVTGSAATVSGTIDPKGDTADWRVQLSTAASCTSGFANQAQQTIAEGSESPLPVSFNLTGLLPSQHYCVRISATNSFGTATSETKEFETATVVPVQVFTAFAAPRLDTSARLNGRVDPEGALFTYSFEYSEDGGSTWIALPEQEDTSETRGQMVVGQELTGLTPSTTYSYRFNAENVAGEASPQGEVKEFTTRSSAELVGPQRGIELVNNPDKGNQNVLSQFGFSEAITTLSPDGNRAFWFVTGGTPGGPSASYNSFLAERGADGWHSRTLLPPVEQQFDGGNLPYVLATATPGLDRFLFTIGAGGPAFFPGALALIDTEQHQTVMGTFGKPVIGETGDISEDGAHAIFVNPDTEQLEDLAGASPELISVMPDGSPSCGVDKEGASFVGVANNGETAHAWRPGYRRMEVEHASRIFFGVKCGGSYAIYQRNRETEETILVDPGSPAKESGMIRSTPDGRHLYFTSRIALDPADGNLGTDVYRWDEGSGEASCLTCVVPNAAVERSPLVSDDFSHVYFQSQQVLEGNGVQGQFNIYVLNDGEIRFVGVPATEFGRKDQYLSKDGDVLVFRGIGNGRGLGVDQLPPTCFDVEDQKQTLCRQVYRYDDRDGSVECISCRHDGPTTYSAWSPTVSNGDVRISADGRTTAFITPEALIPEDVNGGKDVYEWRNGAVHLITDGVREFADALTSGLEVRGVSEDGDTILFRATAPGLTGFEQDGLANLYVARVGGGFEPPSPPTHCSEEACQGPLEPPPAQQPPSSSSFSGHGNVKEGKKGKPRCAKGKVRRRGRCVRKQKRPRKQKGSHHKRASHAKQGRTK